METDLAPGRAGPVGVYPAHRGYGRPARAEAVPRGGIDVLSPHLASLRAQALALTRSEHDAGDLVQDTCVRALLGLKRMEAPPANPAGWLHVLLRNVWRNTVRARRSRALASVLLVEEPSDWTLARATITRAQLVRLWEGVPPAAREIAARCLVEGEDRWAVSRRTGVAPEAIDASIYRTRRFLRKVGLGGDFGS